MPRWEDLRAFARSLRVWARFPFVRLLPWLALVNCAACAGTLRTIARPPVFTIAPRHAAVVTLESTSPDRDVLCELGGHTCVRGISEQAHEALSIMLAYQAPRLARGHYSARFAADSISERTEEEPALTLWWRFELRERTRGRVLAIDDRSTVSIARDADHLDAAGAQRLVDAVLERIRVGIRHLDL